jgi:uncharacterized protein (TIGR02996 family)
MRKTFSQAVIDAPEDDSPRLVFADWLEDNGDPDRAEFIRAQIRLAEILAAFSPPDRETLERIFYGAVDDWRSPGDSPERRELAYRCRRLLDAHEREWLAPLGGVMPCEWNWCRGFLYVVQTDLAWLQAFGEVLFDLHAVRRLVATGLNGDVGVLHHIPAHHRLLALDLILAGIDHLALQKLTTLQHLSRLTELGLMFNRLRDSSVEFLCGEPFFQRLSLLQLCGNQFTDDGRARLRDHFGNRVSFSRERHPERVFAFQSSPEKKIWAGAGRDFTQILFLEDNGADLRAIFDYAGDLLQCQRRYDARASRKEWLATVGYKPATIQIKRFPDIHDFPRGFSAQFDNPDDQPEDYANARNFIDRWLAAGAYRYGSCCGGHWFNGKTGEPLTRAGL